MFGFTLPLFHGRGLLNCALYAISYNWPPADELILHLPFIDNLGLMPYRRRIVSVSESFCDFRILYLRTLTSTAGRPIHTQQCDRPSIEEVTRVQTLYIEELTRSVRFFDATSHHIPDSTLTESGTHTKMNSQRHVPGS